LLMLSTRCKRAQVMILAVTKKYMSLHCLPIYMNVPLHTKYSGLLPDAKFQKGCINFTDGASMPAAVVTSLISECATISIADMLEKRKKKSTVDFFD
jgi:hypothetical protein